MRHFALRLVVALLTFGVGVAAFSLFNFISSNESEMSVAPPPTVMLVAPAPSSDEPPPPPPPTFPDVSKHVVIAGGVLNGKLISKPEPVYPPIGKAARAQGTVVVQILVDESGRVISATAISGHPLLQQAAVAAARQARLSPTLLSGQPVKISGVITYNFVLE